MGRKITIAVVACVSMASLIWSASAGAADQTIEGNLTLKTGDTPHLKFEQIGGAFPPYNWEVAGNEANFFVRDNTGGSKLPFRIRPGAPTSSIDIAADGTVSTVGSLAEVATAGSTGEVEEVDSDAILKSLSSLPLNSWSFNSLPAVRHIGPLAADFNSAFGLGSEQHVAPLDVAGVSLLVGKALASRYEGLATETGNLKSESQSLAAKIGSLEAQGSNQAKRIRGLTRQVKGLRKAVRRLLGGKKRGKKRKSKRGRRR